MRKDIVSGPMSWFFLLTIFGGIALFSSYHAIRIFRTPQLFPTTHSVWIPQDAEIIESNEFTYMSSGTKQIPSRPLSIIIHRSFDEIKQLIKSSTFKPIIVIFGNRVAYWLPREGGGFYRAFHELPLDNAAPLGVERISYAVSDGKIIFTITPKNNQLSGLIGFGLMALVFWTTVIFPVSMTLFGKPPAHA